MREIWVDQSAGVRYLLLIVTLGVLLLGVGFMGYGEPELAVVEGDWIQLKEATEGEILSGSFTLTNQGDSALEVYNFIVTCACVEILNRDVEELAPGESRTVKFTFDTTGYGGKETRKEVMIFSSASSDPERLSISVKVRERQKYHILPEGLLERLSVLVDTRSPERFRRGHIVGAVNVPEQELERYLRALPPEVSVVIYSQSGEAASSIVADLSAEFDGELKSLVGGFERWSILYESYVVRGRY